MTLSLLGTGVSGGVAIGPAQLLQRGQPDIPQYLLAPKHVEAEIRRFETAVAAARAQLRAILGQLPNDVADDIASFIETHLLMLEDATLATAPVELIRRERCNAEWALMQQRDALVRVFDEVDDAYLRTRRDDVEHVVWRIQHILLEGPTRHDSLSIAQEGGQVVLADDLSPGELVLLHRQGVVAVVTEHGGPTSHVAILARGLGLPAVVGVRRAPHYVAEGETVVVDGTNGVLLAGLDEAGLEHYRKRQKAERRTRNLLKRLRDVPAVTLDGVSIELLANIELRGDVEAVRKVGAEGVGLYRTEFLFLNREQPPDEEEQFAAYRDVVKRLRGAPLTIRTLDLGADKHPGGGCSAGDSVLGLRAVRLCLKERELFLPQLCAILRASAFGPVQMLVPMLTTVNEAVQVRELVEEAKQELQRRGQSFDPSLAVGGMIEVPAAALCADRLATVLDFFSIGTNDLIQYTLAADRLDESVSHLYDPLHPAVLRLIRMTIEAGQRHNIPVAMCGEMAGDPALTPFLLGLGLTRFSMQPAMLPEIKHIVTSSHLGKLSRKVTACLESPSPEAMRDLVLEFNRQRTTQ